MSKCLLLCLPVNSQEMRIHWDNSKFTALIPLSDSKCNLVYDGMQIEVDIPAYEFNALLDVKDEAFKILESIESAQLIGEVWYKLNPCDIDFFQLMQLKWDTVPSIDGTCVSNVSIAIATKDINRDNVSIQNSISVQYQLAHDIKDLVDYISAVRFFSSSIAANIALAKNAKDAVIYTWNGFDELCKVNHWKLEHAAIYPTIDYTNYICSGFAIDLEKLIYTGTTIQAANLAIAEIRANAILKAGQLQSEALIRAANIVAESNLKSGYSASSAIVHAGCNIGSAIALQAGWYSRWRNL